MSEQGCVSSPIAKLRDKLMVGLSVAAKLEALPDALAQRKLGILLY